VVAANNAVGVSPDSNELQETPGVTVSSGTNLALNQPAYASSTQGAGYPASAAVDDNFNTRWSSASSDPQWLAVDLGATHTISQVVLYWESAYAKAFQIQTSNDGTTWTTIYSTTTGTGGTQTLTVNGTGRYIRIYGTVRATGYGYSLWEFQVFGT
jgi:beta-glucosidase